MCDIPTGQTNRLNQTKTMKDYFKKNERMDYKMLETFNEHTHIFDTLRQAKEGHHTDAIGTHTSKLGEKRTFNIELKRRFINLDTYPSIYIEDYKLGSMLLDYMMFGIEPLYVNFLNDNTVVIFNLNKLTKYPKLDIKNINSDGKERTQLQSRRYCLSFDDAVIYHNYNLIKPLGECKTKIYS